MMWVNADSIGGPLLAYFSQAQLFTGERNSVRNSVLVVPIVVGALGTVTNNLGKHLKTIGVTATIELLQKAALLGRARILRKVLEA